MKKLIFGLLIIISIPFVFAFASNAQAIQEETEYNIVIIDNGEEVPLAAEMTGQPLVSFATIPILFLFIMIIAIMVTYIIQCHKYRERIRALFQKDSRTKKIGIVLNWNLFHLKDLENELENYIASSIRME